MTFVTNQTSFDLAKYIQKGDTVFWAQSTSEPLTLTRALIAQRNRIGRMRTFFGISLECVRSPEHADCLEFISYCGTAGNRVLARSEVLDIVPCPYSQLPDLLRKGYLKVDVVLLQVSPPDEAGYCSLGLANDLLIAALDSAKVVIAEVHSDLPRTNGERNLHISEIDLLVAAQFPLQEIFSSAPSEIELRVASHVASLIDDGATLQVGLGSIPDAVLCLLKDRRDLGLHTGVIGDGMVDLVESGALTNAKKSIDTGVSVMGILTGSRRLFRHAANNPSVQLRGAEYTHGSKVLGRIDRFAAINSAVQVDLTGQVNAEVANNAYLGAVGGAPDFLRAAHRSHGGLPIIALPSLAGSSSRIVSSLDGPVTTARCDAGIFVTEHGVADLRGLTLRQRVARMLDIAHPSQREILERNAHPLK